MDQESIQPTPAPVEPISPQPGPSPRSFNPFLILVVLILLIGVGIGGIFLGKSLDLQRPSGQSFVTPTPLPNEFSVSGFAETTNWKTYLNPQFKFSFKYPPNLTLMDNSREAQSGTIWVAFADFPFSIQIEELAKFNSKNYLNMPKISERTINGIAWDILYFDPKTPEGGGPHTIYQTTNKDYRYVISYNWPQYSTEIDQILSTFKFL